MDFPTFFLGLIKEQTALLSAVAWPLAVVWIAYLFRKEVRVLIGRVAAIRSPFANVELKEELAQTQAAVTNAVVKSDVEPLSTPPESAAGEEVVREGDPAQIAHGGHKEKLKRPQSDYLRWLATYRKLEDVRTVNDAVETMVAGNWTPVERLISDMFAFVTGTPEAAGVSSSAKAIRLASVGVITDDEAEAAIEFDSLTTRLRGSKAADLSTLARYASMSESLTKLLQKRWARLKNTGAQADAATATGD